MGSHMRFIGQPNSFRTKQIPQCFPFDFQISFSLIYGPCFIQLEVHTLIAPNVWASAPFVSPIFAFVFSLPLSVCLYLILGHLMRIRSVCWHFLVATNGSAKPNIKTNSTPNRVYKCLCSCVGIVLCLNWSALPGQIKIISKSISRWGAEETPKSLSISVHFIIESVLHSLLEKFVLMMKWLGWRN